MQIISIFFTLWKKQLKKLNRIIKRNLLRIRKYKKTGALRLRITDI